MKNQKAFSVTIRGEVINGAKIGSFKKALGSVDEKLTTFANAASAQYVISGNRNWLDSLFQLAELRLTSGKLSAKGKEVAAYIRAFSPVNIHEKDENGIQTIAIKMNAKNKGVFYSLEKDDNGAKIKIDAAESPEWPLTLREFTNREKPEGNKGDGTKKAATVEKQLRTLSEALHVGKVTGDYAALVALAKAADELQEFAHKSAAALDSGPVGIEPVRARESANTTSGKEKRADIDRKKHAESAKGQLTMPITPTKAKSKVANA